MTGEKPVWLSQAGRRAGELMGGRKAWPGKLMSRGKAWAGELVTGAEATWVVLGGKEDLQYHFYLPGEVSQAGRGRGKAGNHLSLVGKWHPYPQWETENLEVASIFRKE